MELDPFVCIPVEPVGRAFMAHYIAALQHAHAEAQRGDARNGRGGKKGAARAPQGKKKKKRKKKDAQELRVEIDSDCELDDFYGLLGIKHLELVATADDIKRAYRKVSLLCHPDKAPPERREEASTRFKAIQQAYDTLSDGNDRVTYDSSLEFDDSVPAEAECEYGDYYLESAEHEAEFYRYFKPFFIKWARYSTRRPVPVLGDHKTSDAQVRKFYAFWHKFKSWRDFTHEVPDAFDLNHAENRAERTWMKKENQAMMAPYKDKEAKRISRMVELAHARDPRVQRMRLREEEELEREEREKEERARQKEEARLAKLAKWEAAEKAKRDAQRKEEQRKQQELAQMRHEIERLPRDVRRLCTKDFFHKQVPDQDVELLCFHCTSDELKSIVAPPSGGDKQAKMQAQLARMQALVPVARQRAEEKKRKEKEQKKQKKKDKDGGKPWTPEELTLLHTAVGKFPGGTQERWTKIRNFMKRARSEAEIIAKVRDLSKPKKKDKKKRKKAAAAAAAKEGGSGGGAPSAGAASWTADEQKALEVALKACRTLPAKERWDKIASMVPGRDKQQCMERYKYIRAQLIAKKQAAQAANGD